MSQINPRIRPDTRPEHSIDTLFKGIRSGDRNLLSQAVTLVESRLAEHRTKANELLSRCLELPAKSTRIGISGVPGVGKSTLINQLGKLLRERDLRLAILAIDPSSARTGGSILGDKTRMADIANDPDVFIRPTAASGLLGGVHRSTREAVILCEAADYDVIIIETVGVGQSEIDIADLVDFFLLLVITGAGDDLQSMKRGIMEMADGFAITKSDGKNIDLAKRTRADLETMLQYIPPLNEGIERKVYLTSAAMGVGIHEMLDGMFTSIQAERDAGRFQRRRVTQAHRWFERSLGQGFIDRLHEHPKYCDLLNDYQQEINSGHSNPFLAAEDLLNQILK